VTPPAGTAARSRRPVGRAPAGGQRRRPAPAYRRHTIRRRRRRILALGLLAALAAGLVLARPLFRKVESEFGLPLQYAGVIRQQAAAEHLDPALIAAVIYAETKFDPSTSPAGAEGLMQLEPSTAEFLAHRSGGIGFQVADLAHPVVNIAYGSYYLRYLLDEYHGNLVEALAAYNGGETNVDRWLAAARARGRAFTVADIPFPETRAYVLRVLEAEEDYRSAYRRQLGY
jgi:soluble lytic murein transglycosylase